MVSRQETARPLLTPGEVMQLPPADELVLVSGVPPIRAKKVRYFEDIRLRRPFLTHVCFWHRRTCARRDRFPCSAIVAVYAGKNRRGEEDSGCPPEMIGYQSACEVGIASQNSFHQGLVLGVDIALFPPKRYRQAAIAFRLDIKIRTNAQQR